MKPKVQYPGSFELLCSLVIYVQASSWKAIIYYAGLAGDIKKIDKTENGYWWRHFICKICLEKDRDKNISEKKKTMSLGSQLF